MHPSLALHLHDQCKDIIKLFEECHEQNSLGKFIGSCNKLKLQMDKCLKEEAAARRKANREAAAAKKKAFQEKYNEELREE